MTLEDLIYTRLTESTALTEKLAKHDKEPAIFYQATPGDTSEGWGGKPQYPRIDYTVDMQSNPERPASGTLTVNIWCSETGEPPENLEPEVRAAICDVFLQPDAAPPFSLSWERSDAFQAQRSDEMLVNGITVLFDLFAFPSHETTDPDPVLAINEYAKKWAPEALVIGRDTLAPFTFATEQQPIFYFRLSALSLYRETNTVAWLNGVLTGHIFAPETTRMKWLKALVDSLALDGEVIMLDKSPMFLTNIKADSSASPLAAGQLQLSVRFGLLRRKPYAHPLMHTYHP